MHINYLEINVYVGTLDSIKVSDEKSGHKSERRDCIDECAVHVASAQDQKFWWC